MKTNSSPNGKWNFKMYTNCKINLPFDSIDRWVPRRKDMQLIIDLDLYVLFLWRSAINWHTSITIFVHFHVLHLRGLVKSWQRGQEVRTYVGPLVGNSISCLGWNSNQFQIKQEMELEWFQPKQEMENIKMYTDCKIDLSVDSWPPRRKD